MKAKHQRLTFLAVSLGFLCAATLLALQAFRDNVVFFYTPSDLVKRTTVSGQRIRVGGLVEEGSVRHRDSGVWQFRITDGDASTEVVYQGLPPGLFREGQGVVAEGYFEEEGPFIAEQVLTKHDEYYMPREVVDALKKSGRWQGEGQTP